MSLLSLAIVIIVIGVLLWVVNSYIPMDDKIKKILNVVVVVALILWVLMAFLGHGNVADIKVPRVN